MHFINGKATACNWILFKTYYLYWDAVHEWLPHRNRNRMTFTSRHHSGDSAFNVILATLNLNVNIDDFIYFSIFLRNLFFFSFFGRIICVLDQIQLNGIHVFRYINVEKNTYVNQFPFEHFKQKCDMVFEILCLFLHRTKRKIERMKMCVSERGRQSTERRCRLPCQNVNTSNNYSIRMPVCERRYSSTNQIFYFWENNTLRWWTCAFNFYQLGNPISVWLATVFF